MRSPSTVALIASLGFALSLFGGAPATAQSLDVTANPVHCAVEVEPLGEDITSPDPVCFSSPEEVEHYLARARLATAAASVVLGTVYSDQNFAGSSLTYWGSSGCTGVTFGYPSVESGWSSAISSARAFNGCWVTLYSETSYGGTKLTCTPDCPGVGSLNDATRSLVFRPTGTWG